MLCRKENKKGIVDAMTDILLFAIIALISVTTSVHAVREYSGPEECGLYLAPSMIPGAGLGMYAGSTEYAEGSLVSDSELMLPTWDLDYHNGNDKYYHLWNEYTWSSGKSTYYLRMEMKNHARHYAGHASKLRVCCLSFFISFLLQR